ncbi:carbon-nitrogen hydrolase family protein [Actinoplanes hulinensis]|uniref:Carbon-nitrogen hydrolase family protein n=1 Tax=Actinoplanes hulinensis TaxID=1144547 RepID=A0ABS7B9L9_9ACTN|nr:carbon-nitrogen hydrolase family protein [Actinoplanes hulinensis]MBW6436958.1 carbon-nitrogen hydrolase family protein [Actinoplanes hulinensis]
MRIGVCQTPEILGNVDAAVEVVQHFAERAAAEEVDLLVFPECFLQGYLVTEQHVHGQAFELGSAEFDRVLGRVKDLRPVLVLGMIERTGHRYYNTAAVIEDGRLLGRYRKTFLTSGESIFARGDDYPVFDVGGIRFGINICYDAQFPEAAAAVAAGGASVLLLPAQNMMRREKAIWWQGRHNEIRAHRARENNMWLASADVTGKRDDRVGLGPTCFLSPSGDVTAQVPIGEIGMVTADIPRPGRRPPER